MITASVPLSDPRGRVAGTLVLRCLRGAEEWNGIPTLQELTRAPNQIAASVQLLEEVDYDYELDLGDQSDGAVQLEPAELFSFSTVATRGRFTAGRATGTVSIQVEASGTPLRGELEIRSRKLDYESDYRAMLSRIARESAELAQSSFAASSLRAFQPDTTSDPATLYSRYAFVQSLMESELVTDALRIIEHRPHSGHEAVRRPHDPARGLRPNPHVARKLSRPGPRRQLTQALGCGVSVIRDTIEVAHSEPTYDTVPNRFVRHVLEQWRILAHQVAERLTGTSASDQRGRREALSISDRLTSTLRTPSLREAGPLRSFPADNQVLQGRAGYREILSAFLLAEAAATISWDEASTIMSAGQRDVATLYEYWVFLELVRILEALPAVSVDRRGLVTTSKDGLSLQLRRQSKAVVVATTTRRGRPLKLELWFNKQFRANRTKGGSPLPSDGSWTEPVRPDCSIRISPEGGFTPGDAWVHFDAKYRMSSAESLFDDDGNGSVAPSPTAATTKPLARDLLKMHAYRDAVRRSAGAYVLYPGDGDAESTRRQKFHEILPGLGAFVLRPGGDGEASDAATRELHRFLEEVLDHVAAQGTAAERTRYWEEDTYYSERQRSVPLATFSAELRRPPADTKILVGFVRSQAHLEWCIDSGLYNMRADPERAGAVDPLATDLNVDFALLYDEHSSETWAFEVLPGFVVHTRDDLLERSYPDPHGDRYLCVRLGRQLTELEMSGDSLRRFMVARPDGAEPAAPLVTGWTEVLG